jgi:hypothetical protein
MHERSRERRLARQHGSLVPLARNPSHSRELLRSKETSEHHDWSNRWTRTPQRRSQPRTAGRRPYAAERILARAGLSDDQIATVTGHEASEVPASIENDTTVVSPAREQPVIDRARAALLAHRASKS